MKILSTGVLLTLVVFISASASVADSITLQNGLSGYTGCADAYLKGSISDDKNYGGSLTLEVGVRAHDRDFLIAFDLSPIPAGQRITSASLGLYWIDDFGISTDEWLDVAVFPLKKSWTEGTGDGQGGEDRSGCSWLYQYAYPSTTTWANGGANSTTHDRDADWDDKRRFGPFSSAQWVTWDGDNVTGTVSDWYTGGRSNYGWVADFTGSSDDGQSVDFNSSELAETSYLFRPKLTITYEPIPEPATLLLVATGVLGGFGLLKRRKS